MHNHDEFAEVRTQVSCQQRRWQCAAAHTQWVACRL